MTEVLWPPDLIPSNQRWGISDPVGAFGSPFTGDTKTYGRPGTRMTCTLTFPPLKGEPRARMIARVAALKGRGNRIWVPDWSTTLETGAPVRGSFPSTELLPNSTFTNTTGLTAQNSVLSVSDRVLRVTANGAGATNIGAFQTPAACVAYAPYVVRSHVKQSIALTTSLYTNGTGSTDSRTTPGMLVQMAVPASTTLGSTYPVVFDSSGPISECFVESTFASAARCALVDNGPNALLYSDQIDNAAWTKNATTVTAGIGGSPDGTTNAIQLTETSATSDHYALQAVTVGAAAADFCFSIAVHVGAVRGWCRVQMNENTSSSAMSVYANLSTGALGTVSTGANWANVRAFTQDIGNGWFRISLVGRKTNAATALSALVLLATADGASTNYAGNTGAYLYLWRAVLAQSSVPVRFTQTVATATTGTTQTGNRLYVKGLPASTQNLLKAGDMVQIGGQINYAIAPLDSNAAGLGVLICGNPWKSPADNAPVIVNTPMCKMMIVGDNLDIETGAAQFTPITLELAEAIE